MRTAEVDFNASMGLLTVRAKGEIVCMYAEKEEQGPMWYRAMKLSQSTNYSAVTQSIVRLGSHKGRERMEGIEKAKHVAAKPRSKFTLPRRPVSDSATLSERSRDSSMTSATSKDLDMRRKWTG